MKTLNWNELTAAERAQALRRPALGRNPGQREQVEALMARVRLEGDAAVRELTARFDGAHVAELEVSPGEIESAWSKLEARQREALREAARRIEAFHVAQRPAPLAVEVSPGVFCERRYSAIERVGLYVPGGSAPLPSTVLMLGLPARIAGCETRVLCTPPRADGSIEPSILAAADLCGIRRVFRIGGAQAIAAMAYGTASVPKVDKLFGPGNSWVTQAKMLAAQDPAGAACDMPAGPSEVMVIADESADPAFAAADLLSQAEHGPDSQVVLVSPSQKIIDAVRAEVERQVALLPRRETAEGALSGSWFALVRDLEQAMEVANAYAPEHLILLTREPRSLAAAVRHAGSVFLGAWSPEALGDYASGTNHVLPTYGWARAYGGLAVESFMKSTTFQELTPRGLQGIGPVVEVLAELEGLEAHKRAVSVRLAALGGGT